MGSIWKYGIIVVIMLSGCRGREKIGEKEIIPRVPVTVTRVRIGEMKEYAELKAVSSYLSKSLVKSPTNAYVESISVNPGDHVVRGQKMIILKTKESRALNADSANQLGFSGQIVVKASVDGIVASVDHPVGDYVQEGDLLCSLSLPGSLVFILEVPFNLNSLMVLGRQCEILLPDGKPINGRIRSKLPSMSGSSQTQRIIVEPATSAGIPESLIAWIRIPEKTVQRAVILSKSCILTDEIMHEFWVMKMIDDSTAIKIPVKKGISSGDSIQVIEPAFTASDRILSSGNYGVSDTIRVMVIGN